MDYSLLSSMMTVVMMAVFIGIVVWAWSAKRSDSFDMAARVPLDDDEEPAAEAARARSIKEQS
jgi:cytochrome c oxidase cbb3-type subunit 4